MIEFLQNSTTAWVAISFFVFMALAYKLGRASILKALDGKIDKIRKEIETAESLRVEAQELLAQYQRKQRDAEKEAAQILDTAKAHAEQIGQKAEKDLEETMARREAQLKERIKRIEEGALTEIKNRAADLALTATADIIHRTLDEQKNAELSEKTIQALPKHLN